MWTTAQSWITPRGGEQAWAADTIENKPADAHLLPLTKNCATLWHKLQCVLCTVSHSKDKYSYTQMHINGKLPPHTYMHAHAHTQTFTPRGGLLSPWNSPSHNLEETRLFPNVPSQPGMIQFPLWPTAHTTLSHPILSNRPTQLCIPTQMTCIFFSAITPME